MGEQELSAYHEDHRLASRHVREAANGLHEKANNHVAKCAAAGDHHQGWETTAALNECVEAWAAHLRGHVEEGHGLSQRHYNMGVTYVDAEAASEVRTNNPMTQEV